MPAPFSDRALQIVSINDFTPGVIRFSRGLYPSTYAAAAPPGSAALAYRCMALSGIGLAPFPVYNPSFTLTKPSVTSSQFFSVGCMMSLQQSFGNMTLGDSLVIATYQQIASPSSYNCDFFRVNIPYPTSGPPVPVDVYSSTATSSPPRYPWPFMDRGVFHDPSSTGTTGYQQVVYTTDPSGNWVTIGTWLNPGGTPPAYATGTPPGPPSYDIRTFYHGAHAYYLTQYTPAVDTAGFGGPGAGVDGLWVSNLDSNGSPALAGWSLSGIFFAEMGHRFGVWGSISTGELFLCYDNGGAIVMYGDPLNINLSVTKLPGVVGPGHVWGPGALTPNGLIYATETDGAYQWNGDNKAVKISGQIPDDVLYRPRASGAYIARSSQVAWGSQVMFPNNWIYDTITSSWWQVEDPSVVNFQTHAASVLGPKAFYSSPGSNTVASGIANPITIYQWDRLTPQSSYLWISNPLPVTTDALVSIQLIELVASNTTTTPCTVKITPTIPPGQQPLQQQNGSQPLYFTIPANTLAYRATKRLGYTDYNIQIRIDANNTTTAAAPTIHAINVGYTSTRPAGI